jgi:hypothetical protein
MRIWDDGGAQLTTLLHELVCEAETAVGAEDADAGDVTVRDAVGGLLLHLAEDVSDDPVLLVFGDVRELGPCERMVEVVSERVVFGQVVQVAVLHAQQVVDLRSGRASRSDLSEQ